MNKFFIGLLIVVIGAGAFYFLRKKDKPIADNEINKELIVGKWKMDSLDFQKDTLKDGMALLFILFSMDTTIKDLVYDFRADGLVFSYLNRDTLIKEDSSYYKWGSENELFVKDHNSDTATDFVRVIKLDKKSLIVQSEDSTVIYFSKAK